jgi:hypothetical protein
VDDEAGDEEDNSGEDDEDMDGQDHNVNDCGQRDEKSPTCVCI